MDNRNRENLKYAIAVGAFAIALGFATMSANAQQAQTFAYAPSNDMTLENFANPAGEDEYFEEHELNDAWLGMPVRSSDGRMAGYVADAILDEYGDVSSIIVEIDGRTVEVDGRVAELTDENVAIDMPRSRIASLESASSRFEVGFKAMPGLELFAERIRAQFKRN